MLITRQDATLVRALASLAKFAPQRMRAAHLVEKSEELAQRIEQATATTTDRQGAE